MFKLIAGIAVLLGYISIPIVIGYIAIHFIRKFW